MPSTTIPELFVKSCRQYNDYPLKLVDRARYGIPALQRCQGRFKEQQLRLNLFVPEPEFFVPYLDVAPNGAVDRKNLHSEAELEQWLGNDFKPDPHDPNKFLDVKVDLPCRFIFLLTASTNKPLEITPNGLKRILSYYQVMPAFLDFLYVYGSKHGDDREIVRFSGFKTEKVLTAPKPALEIGALNRSGKRFQICYSFKSVAPKPVGKDIHPLITKSWKIRHAIIYHQFDMEKATQLWVIGDPLEGIQDLVHEHVHPQRNHSERYGTFAQSFKSTLDTHLLYAQWATEEWRWHVQSSEEIMDNMTTHFVAIHTHNMILWEQSALVMTQEREEKIKDTLMALESNVAIMNRLRTFYTDLVDNIHFPAAEKAAAKQNVVDFVSQLDEHIYDTTLQITRAGIIAQIVKDRKEILIQHLNAQTATKQAEYTQTMWTQAKKSGLDAVVMKIITVIAVIYLPATFVATFFSSNVVTYLDEDGIQPSSFNGSGPSNPVPIVPPQSLEKVSQLGLQRFFEVSGPLMVITLALAYAWYKWERNKINQKDGPFAKNHVV